MISVVSSRVSNGVEKEEEDVDATPLVEQCVSKTPLVEEDVDATPLVEQAVTETPLVEEDVEATPLAEEDETPLLEFSTFFVKTDSSFTPLTRATLKGSGDSDMRRLAAGRGVMLTC